MSLSNTQKKLNAQIKYLKDHMPKNLDPDSTEARSWIAWNLKHPGKELRAFGGESVASGIKGDWAYHLPATLGKEVIAAPGNISAGVYNAALDLSAGLSGLAKGLYKGTFGHGSFGAEFRKALGEEMANASRYRASYNFPNAKDLTPIEQARSHMLWDNAGNSVLDVATLGSIGKATKSLNLLGRVGSYGLAMTPTAAVSQFAAPKDMSQQDRRLLLAYSMVPGLDPLHNIGKAYDTGFTGDGLDEKAQFISAVNSLGMNGSQLDPSNIGHLEAVRSVGEAEDKRNYMAARALVRKMKEEASKRTVDIMKEQIDKVSPRVSAIENKIKELSGKWYYNPLVAYGVGGVGGGALGYLAAKALGAKTKAKVVSSIIGALAGAGGMRYLQSRLYEGKVNPLYSEHNQLISRIDPVSAMDQANKEIADKYKNEISKYE